LGITGALTVSTTLNVTGVATLGNGAVLGTPASGTVTNLTGTASININGTVGATTPTSANFTTTTTSSGAVVRNIALNNGTSCGGLYPFFTLAGSGDNSPILFADTGLELHFGTNGVASKKMTIGTGGIVQMTTYGAGTATFSSAGVISSVSDETWKTKDGTPTDPDAMLKKLEPGYWYYNDEKKETFGSERQLGFYAQNVNAAIGPEAAPEPETVITKNKDGTETSVTKPWGYYDRSVLAVTVMSLQKALSTIETLSAKVTALEAK
jgi:hypothetical protein